MVLLFDIVGATLSLCGAYFYVKQNPIAWPLSAMAMPFDIYLYIHKGLIADTILQIGYFLSTIYGWYQWCYGGQSKTTLSVSSITREHSFILWLIGSVAYLIGLKIISHYTVFNIAVFDMLAAVLSLIGQWLMCRKIIQTWFVLILVDLIYISLYTIKGVPFHALMTGVYLAMAIMGWRAWREGKDDSHQTEMTANELRESLHTKAG